MFDRVQQGLRLARRPPARHRRRGRRAHPGSAWPRVAQAAAGSLSGRPAPAPTQLLCLPQAGSGERQPLGRLDRCCSVTFASAVGAYCCCRRSSVADTAGIRACCVSMLPGSSASTWGNRERRSRSSSNRSLSASSLPAASAHRCRISVIIARLVASSSGTSSSTRCRISKAAVSDSRAESKAPRNSATAVLAELGFRRGELEFACPDGIVGVDEGLHAACGQLLEWLQRCLRLPVRTGPGRTVGVGLAPRAPVDQVPAATDDDDAAGHPPPGGGRSAERLPVPVRGRDGGTGPVVVDQLRTDLVLGHLVELAGAELEVRWDPDAVVAADRWRSPAACRWCRDRRPGRSVPPRPAPPLGLSKVST